MYGGAGKFQRIEPRTQRLAHISHRSDRGEHANVGARLRAEFGGRHWCQDFGITSSEKWLVR
jgi:hypothetical protein